jgi:sugar O-acyltransferase (sialic acid O-acetyltransferase NeuD family)
MPSLLLAGLSTEMVALCHACGHHIAALVDPRTMESSWRGIPCHRNDVEAVEKSNADGFVVAIDQPSARQKVYERLSGLGLRPIDLIGGRLGSNVVHGPGLVVQVLANLSEDTRVGIGCRLNIGANVMHDAILGDFVTVAPGAVVLGRVRVGSHCYIGANATILPEIQIGDDVIVGAGAVVSRDLPSGSSVKGNPAK